MSWDFEKKILIIGKTYPTPSAKYRETACTAGVSPDGRLFRLYPIPYRFLEDDVQFPLFSIISVKVSKNPQDRRKESFKIDTSSLRILRQIRDWGERRRYLDKAISPSLEVLDELYDNDWTSLGIIEVSWEDIQLVRCASEWSAKQRKILCQMDMLDSNRAPLEKMPFILKLKYKCRQNLNCKGHNQSVLAWEYYEAFRSFRRKYGGETQALSKIKQAIIDRISSEGRDVLALVGTVHRKRSWIVGGIICPPMQYQRAML